MRQGSLVSCPSHTCRVRAWFFPTLSAGLRWMRAAGLERIRSLAGSPCYRAPSSIIRNICNFRSPHGILRRRSRPEAARSSPAGHQHRTCISSQPVHRLLQVHPGLSPARLLHTFLLVYRIPGKIPLLCRSDLQQYLSPKDLFQNGGTGHNSSHALQSTVSSTCGRHDH